MSAKPCKTRVFKKSCSLLPPFLRTVTPPLAHRYPPFCSSLPPLFSPFCLEWGVSEKLYLVGLLLLKALNVGSLLPPLFSISPNGAKYTPRTKQGFILWVAFGFWGFRGLHLTRHTAKSVHVCTACQLAKKSG